MSGDPEKIFLRRHFQEHHHRCTKAFGLFVIARSLSFS